MNSSIASAFLDASVLYPAPVRDLLLELAVSDLYRARWSAAVHDEWIDALLRVREDLTRGRLERTRNLMDAHVRDALVTNFEDLIDALELPDPDDRHVLAAAIKGRVDVIVTANLRDFPREALRRWDIEPLHPDDFLVRLFQAAQPPFLDAVKRVRRRLKNPPRSVGQYLDILSGHRLSMIADRLAPFGESI